jgi:co-chaperonin GroES (HSP10)
MPKAIGFRVLVKPDDVIKTSKGGIAIVTDERLERGATVTGIVLDVGPEAFRAFNKSAGVDYTPWVKVGDHVFYAKYAGKAIVGEDGENYLFLNDEDICGLC